MPNFSLEKIIEDSKNKDSKENRNEDIPTNDNQQSSTVGDHNRSGSINHLKQHSK